MAVLHRVVKKVGKEAAAVAERRRKQLVHLMIAIKFYCSYVVRCKKPKGASLEFRTTNLARRHLTFGAFAAQHSA